MGVIQSSIDSINKNVQKATDALISSQASVTSPMKEPVIDKQFEVEKAKTQELNQLLYKTNVISTLNKTENKEEKERLISAINNAYFAQKKSEKRNIKPTGIKHVGAEGKKGVNVPWAQ